MLDYDWEKCMLSRKNDIQIKMLRSHYNSVGYMDGMAYKKKKINLTIKPNLNSLENENLEWNKINQLKKASYISL